MTLTAKVENHYRTLIAALDIDMRLPTEREICAELDVSRSTVRLVLTKLRALGLVYAIHGSGYYKA